MAWSEDWTPEIVESNYLAIGIIDESDIEQLLKDSKELQRMYRVMGPRGMSDIHEMIDNMEEMNEED